MVNFATEMERQGFDIPLLIGGATTSRAHTAVKVDQKYHGPVVWVKDASRSVPVVAPLLSDEQRPASCSAEVKADYDSLRARHAAKTTDRPLVSLEKARDNAHPDRLDRLPPARAAPGRAAGEGAAAPAVRRTDRTVTQFVRTFRDYPIAELRDYIDWQPFFNAWEMKGRFPDILNNPATGEAARKLYEDAQQMLDRHHRGEVADAPTACIGLFPANAVGDDIEVYTDESRARPWRRPCTRCASRASTATACPTGRCPTSWRRARPAWPTTSAAFAVTAGLGVARQGQRVQGRDRRLQRDPAGVAGRPARRGLRRADARAGPPRLLGLRARRAPRQRGPDRREVRRHPARPGLPRLPRPHREGSALGPARRRGEHRHRAHRVDGHVAGRVGVAAGTSRTRSRSTSSSAGSAATRSRTTPSARAGRWPRPSAGSRRTWATSPRTERAAWYAVAHRRCATAPLSAARHTVWSMVPALSPSRASDFKQCPLLYRFRTIDKLPSRAQPGRRARHPGARRAGAAVRPARRRAHARAPPQALLEPAVGSRSSSRSPSSPTMIADDDKLTEAAGSATPRR